MIDYETAAKEIFQILRSYNYSVVLYNDDGNQVYEPNEARRFFVKNENMLVSLVENNSDSNIRVYINNKTNIGDISGLIESLKRLATKYSMLFDLKRFNKDILKPKDFSTWFSVTEGKQENKMDIFEGMYGTSRSSYLKLENAKMIIRHKKKVLEDNPILRSRNIEKIFVENAQGERFLLPTTNIGAGRAMTQHVNHGGGFADAVGAQILRMASDFSNLSTFSTYVNKNTTELNESSEKICSCCKDKMKEISKSFRKLSDSKRYVTESRSLLETATSIMEDDKTSEIKNAKKIIKDVLNIKDDEDELSDDVLDSVSETIVFSGTTLTENISKKTNPTVSVLGKVVNLNAWNDLKNNKIETFGNVQLGDNLPSFKTKTAELIYKTSILAPQIKDDSLSNLLGFISERLSEEKDFTTAKKMQMIAYFALKAANIDIDDDIIHKNPIIKEFNNWMSSLSPKHILVEDDSRDEYRAMDLHAKKMSKSANDPFDSYADQYYENSIQTLFDEFDLEDFLKSSYGDDFLYGDVEAGGVGLEPDDLIFDNNYIKSSISSYLQDKLESRFDLDIDKTDSLLKEYTNELYKTVKQHLEQKGYVLLENEDTKELSREDILLPKMDKNEDLQDEVTVKHDDGYTDRLKSLAGLKPSYTSSQ